ncbi:TRAF-like family protein [Wolffia australiana]
MKDGASAAAEVRQAAPSSPVAQPPEEAPGSLEAAVMVQRRGEHSAICRWTIAGFAKVKARALWSRYFEVGGFDCRLLVYPKGDSQALPGYLSVYLQIVDPRSGSSSSSSRWDCFASYRLSIANLADEAKSVHRDSWHRFSSKKKSHGWCDFTPSAAVLDPRAGFLGRDESLVVTADILVLDEAVAFAPDPSSTPSSATAASSSSCSETLSGKFTWRVRNFSLFREMIKTQKIMSPVFPAGDCNLRISVYQSSVAGAEYLSMCLESKDQEKGVMPSDRSCWCLFRMSVLNQRQPGGNHVHKDSYGRFAADGKGGDNTSLGWNDYMKMGEFTAAESGFLVDDVAVFSASFHVIKESSSFSRSVGCGGGGGLVQGAGGRMGVGVGARKSDGHFGKFTWRIENFTRLKDLLKKRKITGLCVKSRRFQIGNRDCRLIVYPRGQSQPPCHLSVFLEVTDSKNTSSDWSCFVSHRLSVVNQKLEEKSITKESQNRYSKAAKDWGWREFVTLTSLFDQDSGFLVQDMVIFSAEVLILKETSIIQELSDSNSESSNPSPGSQIDSIGKRGSFTWRVENFSSFKEIMETRKIFSKFFQAGGCELRIGVYESFDTICIYLESDQSAGSDPDKNFWVQYRMAVVNQKNSAKTVWKESSICTKTWNNSVLQFMKVSDLQETDGGFLVRDTVVFVCEILDCCPWFEFSDLDALASEDDQDALSTDPDELIDSDDSECISGDEEDMFRNLLSRAGFHLTYGDNSSQPQVTLREKLLMDAGAIAGFLTGLRVYLDDPAKVKRLLLPTKLSNTTSIGKKDLTRSDANSPSLMNLLMGVKVLQQAIIDLLLDIMVECCQPSEDRSKSSSPLQHREDSSSIDSSMQSSVYQRLDRGLEESNSGYAVQSSDLAANEAADRTCDASVEDLSMEDGLVQSKMKWPEQSEELLGLIVNSLSALDNAVPQGCPEPRRRPQSVHKIALVLDKAPKHLQPDLIALVPKLIDNSEHSIAASVLIDCLHKQDKGSIPWLPVFGALSCLEFGPEIWQRALFQAFNLLVDSDGELLVAAINFVFKAGSQCQLLSHAVRAVRTRLKSLGAGVPQAILDVLGNSVTTCVDVAEAMLRDIGSDVDHDGESSSTSLTLFPDGVNGLSIGWLSSREEHGIYGSHHMADIHLLLEMLSVPAFFVDVSQVFLRAIASGVFSLQSTAMVLERRRSQMFAHRTDDKSPVQSDDCSSLLNLGQVLSLSKDPKVQDFVRMFYAVMFKLYADPEHHERLLKNLFENVTISSDMQVVDVGMDVLSFLVREEEGVARTVLDLMRKSCELVNVDRAALWHRLCELESQSLRAQEDRQAELANFTKEKSNLTQKLNDAETAISRLKSELRSESERFVREKKGFSEQIAEAESQLEWARSEREEEVKKLSAERKVLQDRLHDAEVQLSQLKSRKRDELKRVLKEKNALAERLKSAEAARKRFDEELKRYATETVTREEVRQSLEDEVRRLTETVGQTEEEKREKEEQVARCEAYIDGMEAKLQTCQQYIHTLEGSLQEEMSRHAPLYGAGLEALSAKELETIARIHEEGLRQIHTIQQQRKGNPSPLLGLPHSHSLYPSSAPMAAVGLPPSIIPNGIHGNGQKNGGTIGPWFNPS